MEFQSKNVTQKTKSHSIRMMIAAVAQDIKQDISGCSQWPKPEPPGSHGKSVQDYLITLINTYESIQI